jgi:osmotically inducible protein OsmC
MSKAKASAVWNGSLKEGSGTMSTTSSAFKDLPFTFKTRFEGADGTNPEELLGAAHAGCFSMAFSATIGGEGFTPDYVKTSATVTLALLEGGPTITNVDLVMNAKIPDITEEKFQELANKAKEGCPVSKLFKAEISLDATLDA